MLWSVAGVSTTTLLVGAFLVGRATAPNESSSITTPSPTDPCTAWRLERAELLKLLDDWTEALPIYRLNNRGEFVLPKNADPLEKIVNLRVVEAQASALEFSETLRAVSRLIEQGARLDRKALEQYLQEGGHGGSSAFQLRSGAIKLLSAKNRCPYAD